MFLKFEKLDLEFGPGSHLNIHFLFRHMALDKLTSNTSMYYQSSELLCFILTEILRVAVSADLEGTILVFHFRSDQSSSLIQFKIFSQMFPTCVTRYVIRSPRLTKIGDCAATLGHLSVLETVS